MKRRTDAPSRPRYHHGDLRNALLEAALHLVAARGVEAFSLREAAREVGVSPAAAYRHFEDKGALLAALAQEGHEKLASAMDGAVARAAGAPGTPARAAANLAAIGAAYVEFAVANPSRFRVMFGPWCRHRQFFTRHAAQRRPTPGLDALAGEGCPVGRGPYLLLVEALDALVHTGAIAPAARAGAEIAAWASVHGLATLLVEGSLELTPAERREALDVVLRTTFVGIRGAPAPLASKTSAPRPGKSRASRRVG